MIEKEIKILDINKRSITAQLTKLWAKKVFDGVVHDVYYDFPKGKIDDEWRSFRVRNKWWKYMYTIKQKPKNGVSWKMRSVVELEHHITDSEWFKKVLDKYGLVKSREKKKHRVSYQLGEVIFDIDKYTWIPCLLEIEAMGFLTVKSWMEKLWLKHHIHKNFGSRWLFRHYWLTESGKKIVKKSKNWKKSDRKMEKNQKTKK